MTSPVLWTIERGSKRKWAYYTTVAHITPHHRLRLKAAKSVKDSFKELISIRNKLVCFIGQYSQTVRWAHPHFRVVCNESQYVSVPTKYFVTLILFAVVYWCQWHGRLRPHIKFTENGPVLLSHCQLTSACYYRLNSGTMDHNEPCRSDCATIMKLTLLSSASL